MLSRKSPKKLAAHTSCSKSEIGLAPWFEGKSWRNWWAQSWLFEAAQTSPRVGLRTGPANPATVMSSSSREACTEYCQDSELGQPVPGLSGNKPRKRVRLEANPPLKSERRPLSSGKKLYRQEERPLTTKSRRSRELALKTNRGWNWYQVHSLCLSSYCVDLSPHTGRLLVRWILLQLRSWSLDSSESTPGWSQHK